MGDELGIQDLRSGNPRAFFRAIALPDKQELDSSASASYMSDRVGRFIANQIGEVERGWPEGVAG